MGIYIKGMEMPTSCEDCPLGDSLHCQVLPSVPALWAEYTNAIREKRLHSDCPLIPVPPHGRLIEDVAVREQIDEWLDSVGDVVVGRGLSYYGELLGCIEDAPTIIPASEDTQKDGGQEETPTGPYDLLYEEGGANTT